MTDHRAEALAHLQALHDELTSELAVVDAAVEQLVRDRALPAPPARKPKQPRDRSGDYACRQCARTFDSQQGLSMHITRAHGRMPDLDAKRAERLAAAVEEANQ